MFAAARLVGIVNATPDSFTDEGAHYELDRAVAHGVRLARQGAAVVEVGGESLRFSEPTPVEEEIDRVVPVIRRLVAELDVPVAIDTFKAPVAAAAIAGGGEHPERPHRPSRRGDADAVAGTGVGDRADPLLRAAEGAAHVVPRRRRPRGGGGVGRRR